MSTLNNLIKAHKSRIFRTIEVKRRLATTGLFETDWQDISRDVKKWGVIKTETDSIRVNKFKFGNVKTTLANDIGRYNPETDPASLWFGFLPRQRSLVRIRTGLFTETLGSDGIVVRTEFPGDTRWDTVGDVWDGADAFWDGDAVAFQGIISGDLLTNDKNEVSLNIRPTMQIFRDFPAQNLTAYDNVMTAQRFMEMVRDHQDAAGTFIFRPFFEDLPGNWIISSTNAIYPGLNTSTAEDVINKNVWDIMSKLAEAENFIVYIDRIGRFNFRDKSDLTSTAYEFHGLNSGDTEFGHTVKKISSYGLMLSKFYTRVQIQHNSDSTSTSFEVTEATLTVSPQSTAWIYGQKTLNISNFWMSAALAASLSTSIFNEVSALKNEIKFSTSFVPQLDILDRATITYNSGEFNFGSLWDLNNWGDTTPGALSDDLIWNAADGESLDFVDKEFKLLSIEVDLDRLESRFIAREV